MEYFMKDIIEAFLFCLKRWQIIRPYIIYPLLITITLILSIIFSSYFLFSNLGNYFFDSQSLNGTGLIFISQIAGIAAGSLLAYFLFVPLWFLFMLPGLEAFSLAIYKAYLKKNGSHFSIKPVPFFGSLKLSFLVFCKQIILRAIFWVCSFFIPAILAGVFFFEWFVNYKFGTKELFYPLIAQKQPRKDMIFPQTRDFINIRRWGALLLSIPFANIFFIYGVQASFAIYAAKQHIEQKSSKNNNY